MAKDRAGDVRATKYARSEFAKRGIETLAADLRVTHGVLYVTGSVRAMAGFGIGDIRRECEHVSKALKTKPEIKDVVFNCTFRQ